MIFPFVAGLLLLVSLSAPAAVQSAVPAPLVRTYPGTMQLTVDATDLERRVFSVRQSIPVAPGPLVLLYPQWVPGSHAPVGNITQMTGLRLSAKGQSLAWTRDPVDMFAFHVQVPPGAQTLEAQFEWVSPLQPTQGRVVMNSDMLHLQFDRVLLYPAGVHAAGITVAASVRLPPGWQFATALDTEGRAGELVRFKPTSLKTLVDSPLMAGQRFRQINLAGPGEVPVRLSMFADSDLAMEADEKALAPHKAMLAQAYTLFGAPPYAHYDFLLAMSEGIGGIGREHWQSTEITLPATYFADLSKASAREYVIPHELVHAWVGKYRRPADLITANFNVPMQNSLLWVYEGQTQYLGIVLETRAGFRDTGSARDVLAMLASGIDHKRGRAWRPLQDTVHDDIMGLRSTQRPWTSWQRSGGDYYSEGAMLWLGVDARIRALSNDRKSLDDVAALFYADAPAAKLSPRAYRFEDVVAALNQVAPYDWAAHLQARIRGHDDKVLQEDLPLTGWKLTYSKTPNPLQARANKERGVCDAVASLGLSIGKAELVASVIWDSPAFKVGITPGATMLAVNGKVFKCSDLTDAISAADGRDLPIELIFRRDREVKVVHLRYQGGLRYPTLERVAGVPDRLSRILEAR